MRPRAIYKAGGGGVEIYPSSYLYMGLGTNKIF